MGFRGRVSEPKKAKIPFKGSFLGTTWVAFISGRLPPWANNIGWFFFTGDFDWLSMREAVEVVVAVGIFKGFVQELLVGGNMLVVSGEEMDLCTSFGFGCSKFCETFIAKGFEYEVFVTKGFISFLSS